MAEETLNIKPTGRTRLASEAAAFATFGAKVWTKSATIFSGESDLAENQSLMNQFELDPDFQVPAGFCDALNTYRDAVRITQFRAWHKNGLLAARAPYHLFFVMMSADVNWQKFMSRHIKCGDRLVPFLVSPTGGKKGLKEAATVHSGIPPFEWFAADDADEELRYVPSRLTRAEAVAVHDPFEIVALMTVGYTFNQELTEARTEGNVYYLQAFFDPKSGPGTLDYHLKFLRGETALDSPDRESVNLRFAHVFLKNIRKIRKAMAGRESTPILTVPKIYVRQDPKLAQRVVTAHRDYVSENIDDIARFLSRRKRHY